MLLEAWICISKLDLLIKLGQLSRVFLPKNGVLGGSTGHLCVVDVSEVRPRSIQVNCQWRRVDRAPRGASGNKKHVTGHVPGLGAKGKFVCAKIPSAKSSDEIQSPRKLVKIQVQAKLTTGSFKATPNKNPKIPRIRSRFAKIGIFSPRSSWCFFPLEVSQGDFLAVS